ncbi:MAG: hypothetical protein KF723_22300 [Rhizobiaceae bacterium]|nr:hypothetical protein [Rhizobiaceae bacterium]
MAVETVLSGLKSGHRIITPTCRMNRGPMGAFDEASERLRAAYAKYVEAPDNNTVNWHLVLVREDPEEQRR